MPNRHQPGRRHTAKSVLLFDDRDFRAGLCGPDRGENARTAPAQHAYVDGLHNGRVTRFFIDSARSGRHYRLFGADSMTGNRQCGSAEKSSSFHCGFHIFHVYPYIRFHACRSYVSFFIKLRLAVEVSHGRYIRFRHSTLNILWFRLVYAFILGL